MRSLAKISPHYQNRLKQTEFCAFYAITHALQVLFTEKFKKKVRINPLQLVVKGFFHIGFRVFNRGINIRLICDMLLERKIQARVGGEAKNLEIKGYRVSHYTHLAVKEKIDRGLPVITTISKGTHALIIVGYNDQTMNYCCIDSARKKGYAKYHYSRFKTAQTIYTLLC